MNAYYTIIARHHAGAILMWPFCPSVRPSVRQSVLPFLCPSRCGAVSKRVYIIVDVFPPSAGALILAF